jgi:uncharacterized membrane protein YgaE (UPF0421/DUF939 family)
MTSGKSKTDKKASKEASKKLVKKTKTAKKTLKQLKKEKQAAESLLNYCRSMSNYFAEQAALEGMLDGSAEQQVGETICQTRDSFLKGFHESDEYAAALTAYRSKFHEESAAASEEIPELQAEDTLQESESETQEY